jgi:sugar lactone lactonase YvrE
MLKKLLTIVALAAGNFSFGQNTIQVSTFAGSGVAGSTDATGTAASFDSPRGVCADASGNIYVADLYNSNIRKISPAGVVTTFAGSGAYGNTDATGTAASFRNPIGVCADASGNIYVADAGNRKIRKISPAGVVTTFAGSGAYGNTDATGTAASFRSPIGVCADASGNIYVADADNNKIRKISPAGVVTTFAGSGAYGNTDATGTAASFYSPSGVCADASGNIYVADLYNRIIRKISPAGVVTTFAGSGAYGNTDSTGTAASFYFPSGVCADASGNIYVAEADDNKIRKISPAGVVTTFAGSGLYGYTDATGTAASFRYPSGVCADAAGNIYVADAANSKIRKIQELPPAPPAVNYVNLPASVCLGSTVDQSATTTGSSLQFISNFNTLNILAPKAICKNDSFVFILNSIDDGFGNFLDTVRQYNLSGTLINTIGLNDNKNEIIAADNDNNIYAVYPDNSNPSISNIRRITPNGFSDFSFNIPSFTLDKILALEFAPDGYLYASENSTGYIKKIDINANITNLPDPAPSFSFNKVVDFAFDKAGDMYLADAGLNKILKRNASDNNYYPAVPGLDTLLTDINTINIDTVGIGTFLFSSKTSLSPITQMQAQAPFSIIDSTSYQTALAITKPKATLFTNSGISPFVWALDTANNQVKVGSLYAYLITPQLPSGLSYNYLTGQIFGKALAPSPLTTYSIQVLGFGGTTTSTLSFEVATTSTLSNATGTSSTIGDQKDGLTVKYFSPNNCNKMIEIADSLGGSEIGKVEVKETVSNLATFSSGKFVGRVTEINTQNPNANARLKLFFTYQDIQNYNAANGAGIDLTNDTTGGTMQVAVLQLHKDSTGHIEQIQHNPITADWVSAEKNWKVEFPITKFSTFYTGQATEMETFTCADSTQSSVNAGNTYYVWYGDTLFTSGAYYTTLINKNGCDSVLKLNLTLLTTSISESALNAGINVYPNPNNGVFNVRFSNDVIEPIRIRVVNVLGTEVFNTTITGNTQIDLTKHNSGIYFVTIETNEKRLQYRIIKE